MTKVFDRAAALELLDRDEELLQYLIDSFLTENKFERPVLENLISEKKFKEAASYVHATKGAARQLCMEKLKSSAQALEDFLRGKTKGNALKLIDKMCLDYNEAIHTLTKFA
ncbi:Hpt domain-containing protein [uncultured Treponema sp.]|uniref:Hpt domain-containing protein n=1 Tax=uncultured Treponema sp. TaxID=162155 RepID=UPI0025E64FC2|nr:Hpt domain-containing protein [uncultured Treponema sp.]